MDKLEAWSFIGRLGHQVNDWSALMKPEYVIQALRSHDIPVAVIETILAPAPEGVSPEQHTKPFRDVISKRACRLAFGVYRFAKDNEGTATVLDALCYAQARKAPRPDSTTGDLLGKKEDQ